MAGVFSTQTGTRRRADLGSGPGARGTHVDPGVVRRGPRHETLLEGAVWIVGLFVVTTSLMWAWVLITGSRSGCSTPRAQSR